MQLEGRVHRLGSALGLALGAAVAACAGSPSAAAPEDSPPPPRAASADSSELTVRVVEQSTGAPLAGVCLELECPCSQEEWLDRELAFRVASERATRVTDARGEARFELHLARAYWVSGPGSRRSFSWMQGYVNPVVLGEPQELEIALPQSARLSLRGRVENARDHAPIAGARVREFGEVDGSLHPERVHERWYGAKTVTGADGSYRLELEVGSYAQVAVDAPGFLPSAGHVRAGSLDVLIPWNAGYGRPTDQELTADVALEPSQPAPIRVIDLAGRPAAGIDVRLTRFTGGEALLGATDPVHFQSERQCFGRTDAEGLCLVPGSFVGNFAEVELSRGGLMLARRRSSGVPNTFVVGELSRIAGRALTPAGEPVAGQELWLVEARGRELDRLDNPDRPRATAITAADGRYEFQDVCEGEWLVSPPYRRAETILPSPGAVAPAATRVTIGAAQETATADVTIWRGLYIGGTIVDELGRGVPKVSVSGKVRADAMAVGTLSYADGSFLFGPLPDGELSLSTWSADASWAGSETVLARAGTLGLRIPVERAATLRLRLPGADESSDQRTRTHALLQPHREFGAGEDLWPDWDRSGGELARVFKSLRSGKYDLLARSSGEGKVAACTLDLARGEQRTLTLELQPAAFLHLRNARSAPVRMEYRVDGGFIEWIDLPPDAWVQRELPAGSLEIRVTSPSGEELMHRTLPLTAGETLGFDGTTP